MALYAASNLLGGTQQNLSSTYKTLMQLTAQTTGLRRAWVYEVLIGLDGPPNSTDCAIDWDISRCTTVGTGTAVTPNPLDSADAAATTVATANLTVEPTVTAASSLFGLGANQRASYDWKANPGSELVVPATNLAGLAIRAKSATYASTGTAQAYFRE